MLRYIKPALCGGVDRGAGVRLKLFILLLFGVVRQRHARSLMQRTKKPLTPARAAS
jgi:hypothetical protein